MRQLIDLGAQVSVDHDLRESCVIVTLEARTAVEAAAKSAALITETFITPLTIIGIEVAAAEELDPPAPVFSSLIGIREIAQLVEISPRQAAAFLMSPSFPRPASNSSNGPLYHRHAVEHWLARRTRRAHQANELKA